MQVVEFKNEFHIRTDFGRWKEIQTKAIKEITNDYGGQVARFNYDKKAWVVPISYLPTVYEIGKKYRASHIRIADQLPEQVDVIPALPELETPVKLKFGEMRDYQKKGVARGLQLKRYINGDMPGLGKSQILTDIIWTPFGAKTMVEIKLNDIICDSMGGTQKVTGIFPQGVLPTYKVTFTDGTFVHCNSEHIWTVRDANRRRRGKGWTNKTLQEILLVGIHCKINEKRQASGRKPALKWEIPICEPVFFEVKSLPKINPYLLGIMIGDGYLKGVTPQISVPDNQVEIVEIISKRLPDGMKLRKNSHPVCPQYYLTQTATTKKNPVTVELQRLGLNVLGKDKFIPNEYLFSSVELRKDLLRGLLDSDGSCIKNRTVFHSVSKKLCEDVKQLVESLGGIARINTYNRLNEGKSVEYQVSINVSFNPFLLKSKSENWKPTNVTRYIKNVEYVGDYEQRCISVSSENKLYLSNNFVVTHNTLQSIATLEAAAQNGEDVFPALVMCPSALKINWSREFEQWTGRKSIILNDKVRSSWHTYYDVGMADVFIVNYESLRKYFVRKYPKAGELKSAADIDMDPRIEKFNSVIIDEIHKLKNTGSQRTKIALRVTRGKKYIIGLTGTPVVNKPIDLLAQLAIVGKLKGFGGVEGFKARYCEGGSGASNLKELNFLLNKNCFFRREKHEVLKDLPAKIRQTISCELTEEAQKEYSKIENDFHSFLLDNDFSDKEIRKKLQAEVIVKLTLLLQLSAKGKLEAAQEYIDEIIESGQKIVIFCKHKIIVDELCKIYPQAVRVTGSENEQQKQASVDAFQKNPKTNIIIGSHKAAGVGLTLTAASEVLFLELPWHFADLEQCEDRCHRMGQVNSVRSTSLLAEGTLDKWLYDLIMEKKQIADAVTGAEDIVPVNVVDSIMKAFKK